VHISKHHKNHLLTMENKTEQLSNTKLYYFLNKGTRTLCIWCHCQRTTKIGLDGVLSPFSMTRDQVIFKRVGKLHLLTHELNFLRFAECGTFTTLAAMGCLLRNRGSQSVHLGEEEIPHHHHHHPRGNRNESSANELYKTANCSAATTSAAATWLAI